MVKDDKKSTLTPPFVVRGRRVVLLRNVVQVLLTARQVTNGRPVFCRLPADSLKVLLLRRRSAGLAASLADSLMCSLFSFFHIQFEMDRSGTVHVRPLKKKRSLVAVFILQKNVASLPHFEFGPPMICRTALLQCSNEPLRIARMARESFTRRTFLAITFLFVYMWCVLFKDLPRLLFQRRKKIENQVSSNYL